MGDIKTLTFENVTVNGEPMEAGQAIVIAHKTKNNITGIMIRH